VKKFAETRLVPLNIRGSTMYRKLATLVAVTILAQPAVGNCGGGTAHPGKPHTSRAWGTVVGRHPNIRPLDAGGWRLEVKPYGQSRATTTETVTEKQYDKCELDDPFPTCLDNATATRR
jgi:hypothetical protein